MDMRQTVAQEVGASHEVGVKRFEETLKFFLSAR
jgi:hypothetical protein